MPKIKIRFPQIEYKEKILTISDEFLHKLKELGDQGTFIWSNMNETEQNKTLGEDWIESATSNGYAKIIYL